MTFERHIALQGASNFRDFGGYSTADGRSVKWRRLYRSDRLSDLTAADYATLGPHGVRFVYDLRRGSEVEASPTVWLGEAAPTVIHAPIFNDEAGPNAFQRVSADAAARHDPDVARAIMSQAYVRMVTEPAPLATLGRIFARLAEPEAFPAVFHCAGGKDRTGVTCALILGVLGVGREDIADDFMLTGKYYDATGHLSRRVGQVVAEADLGFWSEAALMPIFGVERAYIDTALDLVEAAGGTDAFLVDRAGVAPQALDRLREQLLE